MQSTSALLIRNTADYAPYHNTKAYIRQKSALFPDMGFRDSFELHSDLKALVDQSGYSRVDRFRNDRRLWDDLLQPVPVRYLYAIGVDLHVLEFTIEEDLLEYDRALEFSVAPDHFVIRLGPSAFIRYQIPEQIYDSEKEDFVAAFSEESGLECRLHYGAVKTFHGYPDGRKEMVFHRPAFSVSGGKVHFTSPEAEYVGELR